LKIKQDVFDMIIEEEWEFGVLDIYNYKKTGKLDEYFNFIKDNHSKIEGDICEVGVYKGSSIIATALLLKELNSNKKVFGFDSFSGFPSYHDKDNLLNFKRLYEDQKISKEHYKKSLLNIQHKEFMLGEVAGPSTISTSSDFSETSLSLLKRKIDYLGLDNIVLVDGSYSDTMNCKNTSQQLFMSALMDCDLYESHKISLPLFGKICLLEGIYFLMSIIR
jgi:hypothetical protein